jgi:hypothetical protein
MKKLVQLSLCFLCGGFLQAQKPVADTDLSCVRSLELPTRGLAAARSDASGTVSARVHVGAGGKIASLDLDGGTLALRAEVEVAMSLSEFSGKCQGRAVGFVFHFTLEGPAMDYIVPPGVRFLPPNRFELIFRRVKPSV